MAGQITGSSVTKQWQPTISKRTGQEQNRLSNAAKVALILFGVAPGMHKRVHVHIDENTEEEKARGENFK